MSTVYREERGQQGRRRLPREDGGENESGNFEIEFDNGYTEEWIPRSNDKYSIGRIVRLGGR